jgi:hypothetical protein
MQVFDSFEKTIIDSDDPKKVLLTRVVVLSNSMNNATTQVNRTPKRKNLSKSR